MKRDLFSKLDWSMRLQLERPSNYDRRVVLEAADVEELMNLARQSAKDSDVVVNHE